MLQDLAVQLLNISLMFSVGLTIDLAEVRVALRRVRLLAIVVLINFAVLPLTAWSGAQLISLPGSVQTGILLAAVSPGGGTGTLLTRAARGSLEVSIVVLGLLTALAVPLTPLLALQLLSGGADHSLDLQPLLRTLIVFQLLPLCAGIMLRQLSPQWASRADRIAGSLANLVFAVLILGLSIVHGHLIAEVGLSAFGLMLLLVVVSLGLPAVLPASPRDRAALSLTTGVRNLSLALLLSSSFFDHQTMITVLVYGLVMYLVSIGQATRLRSQLPKSDLSLPQLIE